MPKPLTLRAADAALRALLSPRELRLISEPFPSAFLNGEAEAKFFGPTWDDVVRQAYIASGRQVKAAIEETEIDPLHES